MPELTFRKAVAEFLETEGFNIDDFFEEQLDSIDVNVQDTCVTVRIYEKKGQARICGNSVCLADPKSLQTMAYMLHECNKTHCKICTIRSWT